MFGLMTVKKHRQKMEYLLGANAAKAQAIEEYREILRGGHKYKCNLGAVLRREAYMLRQSAEVLWTLTAAPLEEVNAKRIADQNLHRVDASILPNTPKSGYKPRV